MWEWKTNSYRHVLVLGWYFVTLCALAVPALGQTGDQVSSGAASSSAQKHHDYTIGSNDVLSITVEDSPEMGGRYQVTDTGYIVLLGLSPPIRAQGLTVSELSKSIAEGLRAAELLREPKVTIFVEQYHSQTVTVLGAVGKPSVYALEKPTTLLEVLSLAGGLKETAGSTVTLVRKGLPLRAEGLPATDQPQIRGDWTQTINLARLMEGMDPSMNFQLQAGDVVSVSTAPVIYVAGAVARPGGFALQDPRQGITVLKALAMAEGLKSTAAAHRSLIVRRPENGEERQEIPIDVAKLMAGKMGDQSLEPNDILFIPESRLKKSTQKMADVAVGSANTLVFYGLGTRIQRR